MKTHVKELVTDALNDRNDTFLSTLSVGRGEERDAILFAQPA
jgi:hypothetical protein